MNPDSEDLTTFITSCGAFKYLVLPFSPYQWLGLIPTLH
jgi:hypothetical protein